MPATVSALSAVSGCFSEPALDLGTFPVIRMVSPKRRGHAFAWCGAMGDLLRRGQPFVLVECGPDDEETEADRRARTCWIRRHAVELGRHCRGVIAVQADIAQRCETRARALALVGGAGLRVVVVSNEGLARQLSEVLVGI
jgi:hypothetical protein